MANGIDGAFKQWLRQQRPEDRSAAVCFRSEFDDRSACRNAFPGDLDPAADLAYKVSYHPYAAQLAMVQNSHPVAQGLGVGKDVSGKKDRLAFVLECLDQVTHLAAADRV